MTTVVDAAQNQARIDKRAAYLALALAAFLWGSMHPVAKMVIEDVGPAQISLVRALLAALTLTTLVWLRGDAGQLKREIRGRPGILVVLGCLNFFLSSVVAMAALQFLPASVNGLLLNLHPVWVAIGTAIIAAPRAPFRLIAGTLVAFCGVVLVLSQDGNPFGFIATLISGALDPRGVGLSLLGSAIIAVATVIGRQVMRGADAIVITSVTAMVGVVPSVAFVLVSGGVGQIMDADLRTLLLLVYLGVGCTAMNFTLFAFALKHLSAASASTSQYAIPPINLLLSFVLIGEPLGATLLFGAALILIGVVAAQEALTFTFRRPQNGSG